MGDKAKDLTSTVLSPLDVPYHLKHVITGNPDPKRSRPGHAYYAAKGGLTGYGGYALVDRNIPEVREIATNEDTTLQGKLRALMALR